MKTIKIANGEDMAFTAVAYTRPDQLDKDNQVVKGGRFVSINGLAVPVNCGKSSFEEKLEKALKIKLQTRENYNVTFACESLFITIKESDKKNPNTGKNYINLYFVEVFGLKQATLESLSKSSKTMTTDEFQLWIENGMGAETQTTTQSTQTTQTTTQVQVPNRDKNKGTPNG